MTRLWATVKDHLLIGGPNAVAGWGLLTLLVFSRGFVYGRLIPELHPLLFALVLTAAVLTGNGVYAINACYDVEADRINKPTRPIPAGRMTREHGLKYSSSLMAAGLTISVIISMWTRNPFMFIMWSLFTVLGIAYSMPPFSLKARHVLGNLCFAVFAIISFAIGYVWTPNTTPLLLLGISYFLGAIFIAGIVTMKDFRDYEGDKANHDVTLPVRVGKIKAALISMLFIALPLVAYVLLWPLLHPTNSLTPGTFFHEYWLYFLLLLQFAGYILLETVDHASTMSEPYSKTQYYFAILLTAYMFLRTPLGLNLIAWLAASERLLYFALFGVVSIASIIKAMKGRRVLDQTGVVEGSLLASKDNEL